MMKKNDYDEQRCCRDVMETAGVAAGPVYSIPDMFEDAHFQDRGVFQEVPHPALGMVATSAPTPRLSATPGEVRHLGPDLGGYNEEVYGGLLGLTKGEIEALRAEEVI